MLLQRRTLGLSGTALRQAQRLLRQLRASRGLAANGGGGGLRIRDGRELEGALDRGDDGVDGIEVCEAAPADGRCGQAPDCGRADAHDLGA